MDEGQVISTPADAMPSSNNNNDTEITTKELSKELNLDSKENKGKGEAKHTGKEKEASSCLVDRDLLRNGLGVVDSSIFRVHINSNLTLQQIFQSVREIIILDTFENVYYQQALQGKDGDAVVCWQLGQIELPLELKTAQQLVTKCSLEETKYFVSLIVGLFGGLNLPYITLISQTLHLGYAPDNFSVVIPSNIALQIVKTPLPIQRPTPKPLNPTRDEPQDTDILKLISDAEEGVKSREYQEHINTLKLTRNLHATKPLPRLKNSRDSSIFKQSDLVAWVKDTEASTIVFVDLTSKKIARTLSVGEISGVRFVTIQASNCTTNVSHLVASAQCFALFNANPRHAAFDLLAILAKIHTLAPAGVKFRVIVEDNFGLKGAPFFNALKRDIVAADRYHGQPNAEVQHQAEGSATSSSSSICTEVLEEGEILEPVEGKAKRKLETESPPKDTKNARIDGSN